MPRYFETIFWLLRYKISYDMRVKGDFLPYVTFTLVSFLRSHEEIIIFHTRITIQY